MTTIRHVLEKLNTQKKNTFICELNEAKVRACRICVYAVRTVDPYVHNDADLSCFCLFFGIFFFHCMCVRECLRYATSACLYVCAVCVSRMCVLRHIHTMFAHAISSFSSFVNN